MHVSLLLLLLLLLLSLLLLLLLLLLLSLLLLLLLLLLLRRQVCASGPLSPLPSTRPIDWPCPPLAIKALSRF
jgi:hypothetical protein